MKKIIILLLASLCCSAKEPPKKNAASPIEFSKDVEPPGLLGTMQYQPTKREASHYKRLPEKARVMVQNPGMDLKFSLPGHDGEFVGWIGIIRVIETEAGTTKLTIENKYYHDLTDLHIQTVLFSGAGDFRAHVPAVSPDLLPLSLVRVYGKVVGQENGLPLVKVEYMRVWQWFQFNFMDHGEEDHSNPKWREHAHLDGLRIYSSRVSPEYYIDRLGPTDEEHEKIKAFHIAAERAASKKKKSK